MTDRLRAALARGPVLLDAAMGTRLIARGLDLARDDPAGWVVDRPAEVLEIHRQDVRAGADAVLTATFGANRAWLARYGLADRAALLNRRAVGLARLAVGPDGFVLGSIGPTASDDPDALREQAGALVGSGVDAFLLETHRLDQALRALAILALDGPPVLASLFDWPDPVAGSARALADAGAAAIGTNCRVGMAPALRLARSLRAACDLPILVKPSAGLAGSDPETPESFAAAVPELLGLGVRLIGGCCGTTAAHVAALRTALSAAGKPG